jgi:hypothetical protein
MPLLKTVHLSETREHFLAKSYFLYNDVRTKVENDAQLIFWIPALPCFSLEL